MLRYYTLDKDRKPVLCTDVLEWSQWFESADKERRVAATDFTGDPTHVSTVFLGVDHGFSNIAAPILYETMVFSPEESPLHEFDGRMDRYATEEEALAGHSAMVAMLHKELLKRKYQ